MKILNHKNNLEEYLLKFRGKKISIITGFASGTESLVLEILNNGNRVDLIIGTINAFSSPKFIEELRAEEHSKLSLYVDFRYEESIHWKLYLIKPNIVIIGSANFTQVGIKLGRDTVIAIEDKKIYNQYSEEIENLKNKNLVVKSSNKKFRNLYFEYVKHHKKRQSSLISITRKSNIHSWLSEDSNQLISLFIWDTDVDEEDQDRAEDLIKDNEPSIQSKEKYRLSTYKSKKKNLPYQEGELIITSSHKGSYIRFEYLDRILHFKGMNYLYSFKYKKINKPFEIKEIENGLRKIVPSLYEEGRTILYREDIEDLI